MNSKRAKKLRKLATAMCSSMDTRYKTIRNKTRNILLPGGKHFPVNTDQRILDPACFRGTYQSLKKDLG